MDHDENGLTPPVLPSLEVREVGHVKDIRHGVIKIEGLPSCVYGQLIQFANGTKGLVMGFNPEEVLAVVLGPMTGISIGDSVSSLRELLTVPVGEGFLGRIVDSLAHPVDGKGEIAPDEYYPVFREAPGVMERDPVEEPLMTGIKIIDMTIPIGRGQRQLIIGDRQTGKSSIGVDTIMNQKGSGVVCIYCWIGGPEAGLRKIISALAQKDALAYTIIVNASADTGAAEQYLAPYTAAALGEYFMYHGKHVLVVFDDLSKHAWIYRQISLLLDRAPGREAYPGDIFFLHSQLLERAGKLNTRRGSGSMTFLPIVETLQGDIAGYIQTNIISITDGQIYINAALFREGFRPAIDMGLSVSRIGSRVQCPAIRELGKGLRLDYAQYREMLRMTKLRTHLSAEAHGLIKQGDILQQLLMQVNNQPVSVTEEILLFYAYKSIFLASLPDERVRPFVTGLYRYLKLEDPELLATIGRELKLTDTTKLMLERDFTRFASSPEVAGAAKPS